MFDMIIENWVMYFISLVVGICIGNWIFNFLKMPSTAQLNKIKEWLLWAVAAAEKELGSGTGQLKLRYVYGLFTQTWNSIAKVISFEDFSALVDEALVRFKNMTQTNSHVANYVEGDKDAG